MNRFDVSLEDKVAVVSDLHLEHEMARIVYDGKVAFVNRRKLVKLMMERLSGASMLILNGDTADLRCKLENGRKTGTEPPGVDGLRWLLRVLDALDMLERTALVTSSHDANIRDHLLPLDIHVRKYCLVPTGKTFVLVTHGDIGQYTKIWKGRVEMLPPDQHYAIPSDLIKYREELEKKAIPPLPRLGKKWWLVCGHIHNPYKVREARVVGLSAFHLKRDPGGEGGNLKHAIIDQENGSVDLVRFPGKVFQHSQ